jgi:hypothetical protein
MATTTPNFGWPVPTSTDLVKDGAVAIEGLGDAIDASLLDLKGGTTGQVLTKASGTDMDFSWTAVDPLIILDAKGDLITATAADTPARLAVGTNNQVLTADSSTATGLKWASPASSTPTFVGVCVKQSVDQSISNTTFTALPWNQEDFDTDAFHDNSTNNSRLTVPSGKGGKYLVSGFLCWDSDGNGTRELWVYKNGSQFKQIRLSAVTKLTSQQISITMDLVATDYVQLYVYQDSGSTRTAFVGSVQAQFQAAFLGA